MTILAETEKNAQSLFRSKSFDELETLLDESLQNGLVSKQIIQFKAECLFRHREHKELRQMVEGLDPEYLSDRTIVIALRALQTLDDYAAIEALISSLPVERIWTKALVWADVDLAWRTSGTFAALVKIEEAKVSGLNSDRLREIEAEIHSENGNFLDAARCINELENKKWSPAQATILIEAYINLGQFDEAEAALIETQQKIGLAPGFFLRYSKLLDSRNELQRSIQFLELGLQAHKGNRTLGLAIWTNLMESGQFDKAIESALGFAEANKTDLLALIAVAKFLTRQEERERAGDLLAAIYLHVAANEEEAMEKASLLLMYQNAMGALSVLSPFENTPKKNPRFVVTVANTYSKLGLLSKGLKTLSPHLNAEGMPLSGFFLAADMSTELGRFNDTGDVLRMLDLNTLDPADQCNWHTAQSKKLNWMCEYQSALQHGEQAVNLDPTNSRAWDTKLKAELALCKVNDAWTSLRGFTAAVAPTPKSGRRKVKSLSSVQGQIVNEYRLMMAQASPDTIDPNNPAEYNIADFFNAVKDNKESTPHAMRLMAALFSSGMLEQNTASDMQLSETQQIPKKLFQFWDTANRPPQVDELMRLNRQLNPDFAYFAFDERSAISYLTSKKERMAIRAIQFAPNPAGKADILRLAVLWHEGGIYMDADDRCLSPLSDFVDFRLRFLAPLEYWMTIANNFLAVRPKDPMIRATLDSACEAFLGTRGESVWLSSGPGAVTRSFVNHMVGNDGRPNRDIRILPMYKIRKHLAVHSMLDYKSTAAHWKNQ